MADLYYLSDLETLARDCLARAGVGQEDAGMIARDVALSQAAGHPETGLEALLRDIRLVRYGRIHLDAEPQITTPASAVLHVDAAHGFAAPAVARAMPKLIDMARGAGIAVLELDRASDPGAMAGAMTDLAEAGLAGMSASAGEAAFMVRPSARGIVRVDRKSDSQLTALLAMAPPAADSPLDGPVSERGWIAALNPAVLAVEAMLSALPTADEGPSRASIVVAPDLLAQIVTA
jgi:(2R)-3-sulfolactate dehydrogenase (NADP+)